jgi:predicted transposase YbfD/YdcC
MLPLADHFAHLKDPRVQRCRLYPLTEILLISLCAMICGAEGWEDMNEWGLAKQTWLQENLGLELANGIPTDDTFRRVLSRLDPAEFGVCFLSWTQAIQQRTRGEVIAIDGKTLRHTFDLATGQKAIHMVSAWASENRLVLGQVKVEDKSNEITAIPALLSLLEISGCIVTLDAMGTQRAIAAQIIAQGGDYLLALKGNQETVHKDVQLFFESAKSKRWEAIAHHYCEQINKDHGRLETRRCWQVDLSSLDGRWSDVQEKWKGLSSLICIESVRQIGRHTSVEIRYFLGSLSGNARTALESIRDHWGIENRVHWVLDVTMNEDASRIRTDHAPANLATLRHITLNLCRREKSCKRGVKAKIHKAAWNEDYLLQLLLS